MQRGFLSGQCCGVCLPEACSVSGDENMKIHCRRHARTCVMRAPAPHGAACKVEPGRAQLAVFVSVADDAGVLFPKSTKNVSRTRGTRKKRWPAAGNALSLDMRSHRAERERFFHVFEIWRDQNGQFVVLHGIMFFSGGRDHITIPDWSPHPSGLHVIRKMVGHAVRFLVYH